MSINPSNAPGYMPPAPEHPHAEYPVQYASSGAWKILVLFVAVLAALGANAYLFVQIGHVRDDLSKVQSALQTELDKISEANSVTAQSNRRTVEKLQDQLETARRQANLLAGQAKSDALKKVEETRARLEAAQEKAQQETNSQISQVKQATDTVNTRVDSVNTEVTTVKTDVASTKTELEKTIADLKRTNGDLNGQGVLIATNGKELAALRALGERNYIEFTIHKAKQAQKVGDVLVGLKKADPKKNRYTIELTADDKTVEKRDRTVNEPLQFLTSKARQPYELVVNDVKKDTIVGYLSVPKVLNVRN
jgi:chromosome segregation ATPase